MSLKMNSKNVAAKTIQACSDNNKYIVQNFYAIPKLLSRAYAECF